MEVALENALPSKFSTRGFQVMWLNLPGSFMDYVATGF
jgi:hypothetical protein